MILYKDIYKRAINLLDDPDISRAYVENTVKFEKMMYPYLENGIIYFTDPTAITWLLTDRTQPSGQTEVFGYDEVANNSVTLSMTPMDDSDYVCMINGKIDRGASVTKGADGTWTATFSETVAEGDEVSVEWYSAGQFNTDFSTAATPLVSSAVITQRVMDILARTTVQAWAEQNKNFILEIRNILTDTDFKLYSPANVTNSKVNWVDKMRREVATIQTKLCWNLYSVSRRAGGYYGA